MPHKLKKSNLFLKLLVILLVLTKSANCFSAIAFDNVETVVGGINTTTLSNFTLGSGSNRFVQCTFGSETATDVSNMTFNSVGMTEIVEIDPESNATISMWYMLEANLPSAGDYSVVATYSGSPLDIMIACMSFTGVAQSAPEASNTAIAESGQTISAAITTLTSNAWVVDGVVSGDVGTYLDTSQDERYDVAETSSKMAGSTRTVATAQQVTNEWTDSDASPFRQGLIVIAIAPASESQQASGSAWYGTFNGTLN